jgi:hypothetical protein
VFEQVSESRAPGDFVRAKVTQALAYDLVATPVAVLEAV